MSGQHQPPDDDGRKPGTPPSKPADSRSAVVPPALDALLAENQRLQHFIECADTPLMRDVMAERDKAKAENQRLREALVEIHEFQCGCSFPGDLGCVARPPGVFEVLRDRGDDT